MFKKICAITFSFILILAGISPIHAQNSEDIGISAQYAIIIDQDNGQVLYEKNKDSRMYPASITKIITCIVALEMIDDLDATTTITQSDIDTVYETGASAADFQVGEVVTYRDILMGAMLPSGADATRALANNTCGSQEKFVEKMNGLVKKLKLENTHFVNTTGIHDPEHYSSVSDMAKLTQYALQNEKFVEIFNQYQYTASNGQHQWIKKVLYNARRGGINTEMIQGCKSGYTNDAQHTLSSLIHVNDHGYICVVGYVRNTNSSSQSIVDTLTLGNYVANHFSQVQLLEEGAELKTIKVKNGKKKNIIIHAKENAYAILPNNYDQNKIEYQYNLKDVTAPVKKGKNLGNLTITYDGNPVYTMQFQSEEAIKKVEKKSVEPTYVPYIIVVILLAIFIFVAKMKPRKYKSKY